MYITAVCIYLAAVDADTPYDIHGFPCFLWTRNTTRPPSFDYYVYRLSAPMTTKRKNPM